MGQATGLSPACPRTRWASARLLRRWGREDPLGGLEDIHRPSPARVTRHPRVTTGTGAALKAPSHKTVLGRGGSERGKESFSCSPLLEPPPSIAATLSHLPTQRRGSRKHVTRVTKAPAGADGVLLFVTVSPLTACAGPTRP